MVSELAGGSSFESTIISFVVSTCLRVIDRCNRILEVLCAEDVMKQLCSKLLSVVGVLIF